MNYAARLLNRALRGEIKELIEYGFDPGILDRPYREALQILSEFYLKTGEVLPLSKLVEQCAGLEKPHVASKAEKRIGYYWNLLKSERIDSEIQVTMESVADLYNNRSGDPKKVLDSITKQVLDLTARVASIDVTVPSNPIVAKNLKREYIDSKAGKMPGIPFPPEFLLFIETIGKLKPGHITTIAARTEVGKTWLALIICLNAILNGFKSLVASMEMPIVDIVRRLACLAVRVNFDRAIKGTLQGDNETKYMKALDDFEAGTGLWQNIRFVDPSEITSVEAVEIKAANFGAELVVADAFYDWPYRQGLKDYEGIRSNLKTVRRVSLISKRHWLLTAQLNRRADKVYTSDEFSMGGSDAFNYLSNYVINLIQRKKDKKNKKLIVRIGKKRDAPYAPPRIHNWDFMRMDISQVGIYNEDKSILEGGGDI